MHHRTRHEREQLELFRALPGDLAPRDAQDLMAYPFFSLAKTHRTTPIDFRMNEIAIRVEAVPERGGWRFDFRHLYAKSASLSPLKRFAFELRDIARRQPLPGYQLTVERATGGRELLAFAPAQLPTGACGQSVEPHVLLGTNGHVLSGTGPTCYQEPESRFYSSNPTASEPPNLESNLQESNSSVVGDRRERWKTPRRPR